MNDLPPDAPKRTPLDALMRAQGGVMTPFAGYALPAHFADGVMREHRHTREAAGLFDVSHMGQIRLSSRAGDGRGAAHALERLMPSDILGLPPGRQRYGLLTDERGGILDDLMVANFGAHLLLVVNAARKEADIAHLRVHLGKECAIEPLDNRALVALQGPLAQEALAPLAPAVGNMRFLDVIETQISGEAVFIARAGYTGEDGFEISVPAAGAEALVGALLESPSVRPAGLGARDTLRIEAGLCLYGADIDTTTTPIEAALAWAIAPLRRRGGAREGGFPGAEIILSELAGGAARRRVGLRPEGRAPIRAGSVLFADEGARAPIGKVTSGTFSPTLEAPIAMGYVSSGHDAIGARLFTRLRGRQQPVMVAGLPFIVPRVRRGGGLRC